ncbi:hypothetical protein [Sphingomonas faeni]|uniref:hypothetical protein n=1 Tax=Sphingomonas faeni TaxID=185950 RepID=UPI00335C810E
MTLSEMKCELAMLVEEARVASANIASQLYRMLSTEDRLIARQHGRRISDLEMIVMARSMAAGRLEKTIATKEKARGRLRMVGDDPLK